MIEPDRAIDFRISDFFCIKSLHQWGFNRRAGHPGRERHVSEKIEEFGRTNEIWSRVPSLTVVPFHFQTVFDVGAV